MSLASPGANGERVKFQGNTLFAMLTVNPPDETAGSQPHAKRQQT